MMGYNEFFQGSDTIGIHHIKLMKTTLDRLDSWSFATTSRPLFSSLAVNTTMTPLEANCLHISSPIPLQLHIWKPKINGYNNMQMLFILNSYDL